MSWIIASLVSALFRGFYESFTKHAVRDNAVLPVVFLSTAISAGIWSALLLVRWANPQAIPADLQIAPMTGAQHSLLLLKAAIVGSSWVATYFSVKHLPVSIASPIRATAPLWTLMGALAVLGERPSAGELAGIALTLASLLGLSLAGRREGINFLRSRWVGWALVGTLLAAVSTLYDKHLLANVHLQPATVQAWFSIYLVGLLVPAVVGWKLRWWPRQAFQWRWSIALLSVALLVSDFLYFSALKHPDALVSVVASLRQGSTVVAFFGGMLWFGEAVDRRKTLAMLGLVAGVVVTLIA